MTGGLFYGRALIVTFFVTIFGFKKNFYISAKFHQMKSQSNLLVVLLCSPFLLFAAHDNVPEGGRSAAMANASVAFTDFWSLQNNQAGLAFYNHFASGIYFENRFMVKELSLKAGGVVMPVKAGVLGLNISYFGYPKYNESKFGLAYARSFGDVLAVGVQLDYLLTSIDENYGKKGLVTFEIGLLSKINEHLNLGAHIFNPIQAKLTNENNERIPAIIRLGAAYSFDENIMVSVEAEKDTKTDPILKLGLEYRIIKPIYVRGGISTNPGLYSFGFGLDYKKLRVDFSSSVHSVLGYSPQLSLIYIFK